jgi:hypothetical protein
MPERNNTIVSPDCPNGNSTDLEWTSPPHTEHPILGCRSIYT